LIPVQLILHIGTHKTGTSAIQDCLYRNEAKLVEHGVYYAHRPRSPTLNQLAYLVAKGRKGEARALVDRHLARAEASGANTLLISAESFFAMTMFFRKLEDEACEDYWGQEASSVELLQTLLPADMPKRIVVFFRRQDKFLESIYVQRVRTRPVTASVEQFRNSAAEAMDYWRYMEIWNRLFPDCSVYDYEATTANTVRFFLRNVLEIDDTAAFEGLHLRINASPPRDLVEYKRALNQATSFVDRRMNTYVCAKLERMVGGDGSYRDYLAPDARVKLLRDVQPGNAHLTEHFSMTPFPTFTKTGPWTPYPGLSANRVKEFADLHERIKRSPSYQIKFLSALTRQALRRFRSVFSSRALMRGSRPEPGDHVGKLASWARRRARNGGCETGGCDTEVNRQ
jgi:hypothetical protein